MGRPIYNYELADPDFSWLVSNFKENNPEHSCIEAGGLPVVFIASGKYETASDGAEGPEGFDVPVSGVSDSEGRGETKSHTGK